VLNKGNQSVLEASVCERTGLTVLLGNEHLVEQVKMPWLVVGGCIDQIWDPSMFVEMWLVWGFQINFM
jgi:hypothetical protein